MGDVTFSIKIQGDSDGYVTFECPFCGSEFKLQAGEYQDEEQPIEDLFCPYCGLTKEKNNFLSHEVIEQVETIANNYMVDEINRVFGKMQKSFNRSKGMIKIKMDYKPLKKVATKELKDKDTAETEFQCDCCQHHVKVLYCAGASKIFCPYCGVDI
jgi:transcription elongation factor Elf1